MAVVEGQVNSLNVTREEKSFAFFVGWLVVAGFNSISVVGIPFVTGVHYNRTWGSVTCSGGFIFFVFWLGDCIVMSCRKSINVTSSVRRPKADGN